MKIKIACCQMTPVDHLEKNLIMAEKMVMKAADNGADMVVLPEMFICPYCHSQFARVAEPVEGFTYERLSELAAKTGIYLFAGSVPERADKKIYNTCYVFNRNGSCIAHHRKLHLFDVNIKNGIHFKESRILSAGDQITLADTEFGPVGVAICFDIRFPELFRIMADKHWDLALRSRAVDNQCYIIACSSGRDTSAEYCAWGHSSVVNPWGEITNQLDEKEGILYSLIDLDLVDKVRKELPILSSLRHDLYQCIPAKEIFNGK